MDWALIFVIGLFLMGIGVGFPLLNGDLFGRSKKVEDNFRKMLSMESSGDALSKEDCGLLQALKLGALLKKWCLRMALVGFFMIVISLITLI